MARELTAGWTPYHTFTGRGSLRHLLPDADLYFERLARRDSEGPRVNSAQSIVAAQMNRRTALKIGAASALACGSTGLLPRPVDAGIFDSVLLIVGEALFIFVEKIAVYASDAAAEKLKPLVKDGVKAFVKWISPIIVPATENLYTGEGADFHWATSEHYWMPKELSLPTAKHEKFGSKFGVDEVQYEVGSNSGELNGMEGQKTFGLSQHYRDHYDQSDGSQVRAFHDLNFRATQKGDRKFTPHDIEYVVPVKAIDDETKKLGPHWAFALPNKDGDLKKVDRQIILIEDKS